MAQLLKGKIVSTKMQHTVVVEVTRLQKHPHYGKFMKRSKKYKAHAADTIPVGSIVLIESCRPISKDKKWKVKEVVRALAPSEALEAENI